MRQRPPCHHHPNNQDVASSKHHLSCFLTTLLYDPPFPLGQHLSRSRFLLLCQLPMPSVATHAVIDIGNLLNTNRLLVYHRKVASRVPAKPSRGGTRSTLTEEAPPPACRFQRHAFFIVTLHLPFFAPKLGGKPILGATILAHCTVFR